MIAEIILFTTVGLTIAFLILYFCFADNYKEFNEDYYISHRIYPEEWDYKRGEENELQRRKKSN